MFAFLLTMLLLSPAKTESVNPTAHLKFKVEELDSEEKPDFLVANPYLSQINSLPLVFENCSDIKPPQSTLTCEQLQEAGLCDILPRPFCRSSCCKNCGNYEPICQIISQNGLCNYFVTRGYCQQQCKNTCSNLTEAKVLMTLKNSIQYPDQLSSWTGDDPCDGWDGAGLFARTGMYQNQDWGKITSILKPKNGSTKQKFWTKFSQAFPRNSVVQKNYMHYIQEKTDSPEHYHPNYLLGQLKAFNVEENSISGYLPPEFSTWTKIYVVAVDNNKFIGTLPKQYSTWSSLYQFWLGINQLTGSIPLQFSTFSEIEAFNACYNRGNNLCTPASFPWFHTGCPSC